MKKTLFFSSFLFLLIISLQNSLTAQTSLNYLKITELNYNPTSQDTTDGDEFEFIELKNCGSETIDLTGISFTNGIDYTFQSVLLEAGEFIVLAKNSTMFNNRYGFFPSDVYDGKFSNSGEKVELSSATGEVFIEFEYSDKSPWPELADGEGFTLVSITANPTGNPNDFSYWRASSQINGSPNADDPELDIKSVYINELLTHTDFPLVDAVEIYNPNDVSVNISGWFLTDDKSAPQKWAIPNNTVISPNGFAVFYEGYYQNDILIFDQNYFGSEFSISSHGEEIYIFSTNSNGDLTGYSHGFKFEECPNGISFGRYITSTEEEFFPMQLSLTLGYENAEPLVGPLVISEINYEPADNNFEFLKITNVADTTVPLFHYKEIENTWKVSGIGFEFPQDKYILQNENIYLIDDAADIENFKTINNLEASTQVFKYPSALSNQGEKLEILEPANSFELGDSAVIPFVVIDQVTYDQKSPWPDDASGTGKSIVRINLNEYGNDPINWESREIITDVMDQPINGLPKEYTLDQNYPNPFNPETKIQYSIPTVAAGNAPSLQVQLIVYDLLGREVATLVNKEQTAGYYSVSFDASKLTSGVYIYKITAGNFTQSKKMMLMK